MEIESAIVLDNFRLFEKKLREFATTFTKRKGKRKSGGVVADNHTVPVSTVNIADIINIHTFETVPDTRLEVVACHEESPKSELLSKSLKIFQLAGAPTGFYIIRNALTPSAQLFWAAVATQRYSKSVHTNLTNLRTLDSNSSCDIQIGAANCDWELSLAENNDFQRFKKLRWSSLGYHYDWTHRMYKQHEKSMFPEEFSVICKALAKLVDLEINPEAGIVNYYPLNAQMCGHLDDAEHCMTEPIVSLSLGCSGLFLIGGRTKDISPVTLLLRSGDVVIMSGESRYCYHGVPVILSQSQEISIFGTTKYACDEEDGREESPETPAVSENFNGSRDYGAILNIEDLNHLSEVSKYLLNSRVNINARRVTLGEGVWVDKNGSGYEVSSSSVLPSSPAVTS